MLPRIKSDTWTTKPGGSGFAQLHRDQRGLSLVSLARANTLSRLQF